MTDYVTLDLKNDKEVLGSFVALLGVALAHRNGGAHNQMHAQILSAMIAHGKVEVFGLVRDRALYGIQVWEHGEYWTDATAEVRLMRLQYIHGETTDAAQVAFFQWGLAAIKGKNAGKRVMVTSDRRDQMANILPKCGLKVDVDVFEG